MINKTKLIWIASVSIGLILALANLYLAFKNESGSEISLTISTMVTFAFSLGSQDISYIYYGVISPLAKIIPCKGDGCMIFIVFLGSLLIFIASILITRLLIYIINNKEQKKYFMRGGLSGFLFYLFYIAGTMLNNSHVIESLAVLPAYIYVGLLAGAIYGKIKKILRYN